MRFNKFLHSCAFAAGAALVACSLFGQTAHANRLRWSYLPYLDNSAKIIRVPGAFTDSERTALAERDARWLEYCKPELVIDELGVSRYQYARSGCEFGKSAD